jgi:hypothetical protein
MNQKATTRRAILAGLAAAPVAGLPALAGAASAPFSPQLAAVIERHKVARAAMDAHPGEEDLPDHLTDAEGEALDALARTPCANDSEFAAKLRYLLADHRKSYGPSWGDRWKDIGARAIMTALDLHLNPEL